MSTRKMKRAHARRLAVMAVAGVIGELPAEIRDAICRDGPAS